MGEFLHHGNSIPAIRLIVLVLDHWPWRKPESTACFSCQNLAGGGQAASPGQQSHLRHQSSRGPRGESQAAFLPRKPERS